MMEKTQDELDEYKVDDEDVTKSNTVYLFWS